MTIPWTTLFDSTVQVAPPLSDQQMLAIPAKRGILALLADNDAPILLLTAADIRARLRGRLAEIDPQARKKTADLRAITRKILWKLSPSHFETDLNYFEVARTIWPDTYTELLAWRPGWFVHVNPADPFPRFVRTRDVGLLEGLYVGPFESGQAADKFIEVIEDAFDLCRDYSCLRQAPHGQPCAYLQMGRCLGPCNGTISMDAYREVMARAAQLAGGDHQTLRNQWMEQMKQAAGDLQFEKAGTLKARLARLDELERPACRHAAPLADFRFILIQNGPSRKQASAFLIKGPAVAKAPGLDYPLQQPQLEALLGAMQGAMGPIDETGRWRMGLAAYYLSGGPDRQGVMLRWKSDLQAQDLAATIEAAAGALHLGKPASTPPGLAKPPG